MEKKIVVKNLYKIFGQNPKLALELLNKGLHKDEIFKNTGMVVGVQNANFHIDEGEIFVIMGLSGSGKSTLIRLLNRLIEPSYGHIFVDGKDVATMKRKQLIDLRRRDMSMVFQSFALLPHLSVIDNAAFGLAVAGVGKKERHKRAMEVLEQVGLATFAKKYPSELSGGMQQRVGLARALAVSPSLMLMDEAFSALDPLIRTEMQGVLLELQKVEKRTVVFVSHDLEEAFRIGSRIAIMEGGRIVQVGTPEEIVRNPADEYVRTFFKGIDVDRYRTAKDMAKLDEILLINKPNDIVNGLRTAIHDLRQRHCNFGFVIGEDRNVVGAVSIDSMIQTLEHSNPSLETALLTDIQPVNQDTQMPELVKSIVKNPCPLPVIDAESHYLGAITAGSLLRAKIKEAPHA